jgi:hypothetical protein
MFDERAFIARVESAAPEELANILTRPSVEEEKALRAHLGDQRYQRMHSMALKRNISRSLGREKKGNVVVIHGIMGSELVVGSSSGGSGDLMWVSAFRIARGWLDRLRLSDDGRSEFNPKYLVRTSGIMKRYYGELLLSLAENWNVQAFWFDWRKDLNLAADELNVKINDRFGNEPVHIVAHSMGGLVARTFIQRYRDHWDRMEEKNPGLKLGGRLVMLGTPNHGSFAIPQVMAGVEGIVKKLSLLDFRHKASELLNVFNSFVGSYQMMPSHIVMPEVERLYHASTYSPLTVSQAHLNNAHDHHERLQAVVDSNRMIYIAGYGQPTFSGIKDNGRLDALGDYEMTLDGDGRVPHRLGFLDKDGKRMFPTYFIKEDHGNLSSNIRILTALDELLENGRTDDLYDDLAQVREATTSRSMTDERSQETLRKTFETFQKEDEVRLQASLRSINNSRGVRLAYDPDAEAAFDNRSGLEEEQGQKYISPEERKVEETITRGFLSYRGVELAGEDDEAHEEVFEKANIEIGLVYGGIESISYEDIRTTEGSHPIDAIAVGHYIGVRPAQSEGAIDEAISRAMQRDGQGKPRKEDCILTQYTERGVIHGKLGQPFFLPDPRDTGKSRLIVLAGMGEPGRFGMPELTVLVRELCWSLGRMDKLHLGTVLIGTGVGNLKSREAVSAWMDGLHRALTGSSSDQERRLRRITFVENNPERLLDLDGMLDEERKRQKRAGLEIAYFGPSQKELDKARDDDSKWFADLLNERWEKWEKRKRGERIERGGAERNQPAPTRVTLGLDAARKTYRFGAITDIAAVPEREVPIDPAVIWQANDELAGERNPRMQKERGRFLEALLIPDELRAQLYNDAPLVMLLDSTTARIHWEMVAQPELISSPVEDGAAADEDGRKFDPNSFLGTSRGFTRQLRTTFAPPPEPPPPPRRVLRVLVIADPAADAHLKGAQEEGVAVADLFESFNSIHKEKTGQTRVEVKRLFGSLEATRTNVLRELMLRSYDVLHFAGHCVYRWDGDPTLSGWIFNAKNKEILSANELTRIDRIPKFVFSNACESGITPDRSQDRSVELAPSFAESFFARGVANFVCTAWPVDDFAARVFALTLYSSLLGIQLDRKSLGLANDARDDNTDSNKRHQDPMLMHEAMKEARTTIASLPTGRLTWGAYQHYGNPYFQFFQKSLRNPAEAQKPADAESGAANTEMAPHVVKSEASAAPSESSAAEGRSPAVST